jgi:Ohr subfamily peroxiredoxin
MDTPVYTASVTSFGDGRNGHATSTDGLIDIDLATPAELGGAGGATNPEQLFAAGYSACFHSALKGAGRTLGIPVQDSAVTADVALGKDEDSFAISVALHIELTGISEEDANRVVEVAHRNCPYSKATRGNIEVTLEVDVA